MTATPDPAPRRRRPLPPLLASAMGRVCARLKRHWSAFGLCALAACTAAPIASVPAPPPVLAAGCPARQFAVLPVTLPRGFPLVQARVNGAPVTLLVDTGAEGSLLTESAIARLGIPMEPGLTVRLLGAGGRVAGGIAMLRHFALGGIELRDQPIAIGPSFPTQGGAPQVDGILGADVLAHFDVEFDLPRARIVLWQVGPCAGDPATPAPGYDAVRLRRVRRSRMLLIASVDGRAVSALLDSGAQVSVIAPETAAYLGVDPRRLGRPAAGRGLDGRPLPVWRLRFTSLRVGTQTVSDPLIDIAAVHLPEEAMLLGDDWLGRHQVWLSYATNQLFVRRR